MPITRNLLGSGTGPQQAQAIVGTSDRGKTATGTTRADAFLISEDVTTFTVVPSGTGAALRTDSLENDVYTIINDGSNALAIYPPAGGRIGTGATNAAYSLPAGTYIDLQARGYGVFMPRVSTAAQSTFIAAGTGAVTRTAQDKMREVISAFDKGATGDGVASDTVAISSVKTQVDAMPSALVNFGGGRYNTSGSFWENNVSPTTMYFDKPSVLGLFDGTLASPNAIDNDPVLWAQKYTKFDNGTDRFAHNVGGVFGSVYVVGSGLTGSADTDGTWIGTLGNAVLGGVNQGTSGAPDFDAYGNVVGVAGFARSTGYPGDGNIVCGTWGYAEGPTLDATTWGNLPATNWSLVGHESNIQINHPDIGFKSVLVGKGSSVGYLAQNYRAPGSGVRDWTFGMVLSGSPNDNNYASIDVDNWSGFYTGLLVDKIKSIGILFGQYFKTGSYGIRFPDTYAGSQAPAAAIHLGNTQMQMGEYLGATFANNDFWHNGGFLYFRYGGSTERLVTTRGGSLRLEATQSINVAGTIAGAFASTGDAALGGNFGSEALRGVRVASAVNRCQVFGATTGNAVVYGADGETTVAIEYRSKGAARQFWTVNGSEVGSWDTSGNFLVNVAGRGLRVKEGSNAKQGTATLVAGTVTVANTSVTANSRIFLTSQVDGGTPGFVRVSARVAGTSFTITSSSGTDTSVVAYQIFEPA